jgi:hypothetical protein
VDELAPGEELVDGDLRITGVAAEVVAAAPG